VSRHAGRIQLARGLPHVLLQRRPLLGRVASFRSPDHENLTPTAARERGHDGQHAFGQALRIHGQDDSPVHLRLRLEATSRAQP
jgi:hypothetical protein